MKADELAERLKELADRAVPQSPPQHVQVWNYYALMLIARTLVEILRRMEDRP